MDKAERKKEIERLRIELEENRNVILEILPESWRSFKVTPGIVEWIVSFYSINLSAITYRARYLKDEEGKQNRNGGHISGDKERAFEEIDRHSSAMGPHGLGRTTFLKMVDTKKIIKLSIEKWANETIEKWKDVEKLEKYLEKNQYPREIDSGIDLFRQTKPKKENDEFNLIGLLKRLIELLENGPIQKS